MSDCNCLFAPAGTVKQTMNDSRSVCSELGPSRWQLPQLTTKEKRVYLETIIKSYFSETGMESYWTQAGEPKYN